MSPVPTSASIAAYRYSLNLTMALEAPLRSSTGSLLSPFSPHTDIMSSPDSPAPPQFRPLSVIPLSRSRLCRDTKRLRSAHSPESSSLRPSMAARPASANNLMSPSDIVGPSPVTSVGTEVTEIEDEMSPEVQSECSTRSSEPNPQVSSGRPHCMSYSMITFIVAVDAQDKHIRPLASKQHRRGCVRHTCS